MRPKRRCVSPGSAALNATTSDSATSCVMSMWVRSLSSASRAGGDITTRPLRCRLRSAASAHSAPDSAPLAAWKAWSERLVRPVRPDSAANDSLLARHAVKLPCTLSASVSSCVRPAMERRCRWPTAGLKGGSISARSAGSAASAAQWSGSEGNASSQSVVMRASTRGDRRRASAGSWSKRMRPRCVGSSWVAVQWKLRGTASSSTDSGLPLQASTSAARTSGAASASSPLSIAT
ncbi:MAG: hypothetical protein J3K34DRAFT_447514 [Monoraphidium minutum]|nr:MAG: hypothetical protein J3K34DRAFT_447514 [Monoraphidium minutum]